MKSGGIQSEEGTRKGKKENKKEEEKPQ